MSTDSSVPISPVSPATQPALSVQSVTPPVPSATQTDSSLNQDPSPKKKTSVGVIILDIILGIFILLLILGIIAVVVLILNIKSETLQDTPTSIIPLIASPTAPAFTAVLNTYQPSVAGQLMQLCILADTARNTGGSFPNLSGLTRTEFKYEDKLTCLTLTDTSNLYVVWTYIPESGYLDITLDKPTYSTIFTASDLVNAEILKVYNSVRSGINSAVNNTTLNVFVTGYGFGGNLGTLQLLDSPSPTPSPPPSPPVPVTSYFFGTPRLGNTSFNQTVNTNVNDSTFFIMNLSDNLVNFPLYNSTFDYTHPAVNLVPFNNNSYTTIYNDYLSAMPGCPRKICID